MRFCSPKAVLTVAFCLFTATSRVSEADVIKSFVLTGQYGFAQSTLTGTVDGTVTIDTTTGSVLSIDFDFVGRDTSQTRLAGGDYVTSFSGLTEIGDAYGGNGHPYFAENIILPIGDLVGYSGGSICSQATPCYANSSVTSVTATGYLLNGNLSLTPEPSTLVYLASGLLPLAVLPRRRVAAR